MKKELEMLEKFDELSNIASKGLKSVKSLLEALMYVQNAKNFQSAQDELNANMAEASKSLEDMMKPAWKANDSLADSVAKFKEQFESIKDQYVKQEGNMYKIDLSSIDGTNVFDRNTNILTNLYADIAMAITNGAHETIG